MGQFAAAGGQKIIVLVATSGDTGGAVADAFHGVAGTEVVILYPSGKVSPVQEKQLTTHGGNIHALEVQGDFDDCQRLVKEAFKDEELKKGILLTSSNSINISRWLSQQIYYAIGMSQWCEAEQPVIAVPSGNFGNLCAGLVAQQSGLPVQHFIAACNANRVFTNYLESGQYLPVSSVSTISNAMDVGNPSNFIRIQEMYQNDLEQFKTDFSSYTFSDEATLEAMKTFYTTNGYIAEPHGAVGYLGLKKELDNYPNAIGIFLETAHPIKFLDVVEPALDVKLPIPTQIESVLGKEKVSTKIKTYEELKAYLG
jgi:threonine synthase